MLIKMFIMPTKLREEMNVTRKSNQEKKPQTQEVERKETNKTRAKIHNKAKRKKQQRKQVKETLIPMIANKREWISNKTVCKKYKKCLNLNQEQQDPRELQLTTGDRLL